MRPGEPQLPSRAWLAVALLWVVACLNYLDRIMLITMRSSVKEAIPMTDAQFGALTMIFLVVYGVLSPLGGFLADRFGRSRVIIFSLLAWSVTTWLTAHCTTVGQLLATRAIMGISEACYFPAAGSLLMDYHRNSTRSLANGIHLSGVMVGSGLGGLGGWIAEHYGWTHAFEIFGIGGVIYSFVLIALLRDPPVEKSASALTTEIVSPVQIVPALRDLFSRPAFIIAVIFWGLLGLASWSFIGWLPSYLSEHFHLAQGEAGLKSMGYIYSASLVGMVLSGYVADRWSLIHPRGRIYIGVIGCCLTVPAILLVANTTVLSSALVGMMAYGLTRAFPDANMMPVVCQITNPRYRATGMGVLNMFGTLVGGFTIYAGGLIRDANIDISYLFNFGAASLLVCAALLWSIKTIPALITKPDP